MNLYNLDIIARHQSKLLIRSRLFQVFFLSTLCIIFYIQIRNQSNLFNTCNPKLTLLPSFIPFMNVYLLSLFQTMAIFMLTNSSLSKAKNIDSMNAIYYRPASNSEHSWGIFLGYLFTFGCVGIVSLGLAALINILVSPSPFSPLLYLFYLFTYILPSTTFILGLSFFVITWIKHQGLTLLILFVYTFVSVFYFGDFQKGIFNPLGTTLPGIFSDFTGHTDITLFLLQRGCWFFLGMAFVQLTILKSDRIPNQPGKSRKIFPALLLATTGLVFGFSLYYTNHENTGLRRIYQETYNKYESIPKASLLSAHIKYSQKGKLTTASSDLLVQNNTGEEIKEILLYLNPSLKIISITGNNITLPFKREYQIAKIHQSLQPGDSLDIRIKYKGSIDENLYYLDIPETVITSNIDQIYPTERYCQRYAFLEKDFTLLTPEALWYPSTIPPVCPRSFYDRTKTFTHYTLEVSNPEKKTIISQGEKSIQGTDILFRNEHPLPGISLCIGDYLTKRLVVDSVTYELNVLKKHAYLLQNIEKQTILPLSELITNSKLRAENKMGKNYPYQRFTLVESPATFTSFFRNEEGGSGYIQPETVFLPETCMSLIANHSTLEDILSSLRLMLLPEEKWQTPFRWTRQLGIYPKDIILYDGKETNNCYQISPLFFSQLNCIHSQLYPFVNTLIDLIEQDHNETRSDRRRDIEFRTKQEAINYLSSRSLEEAIQDKTLDPHIRSGILTLKTRELVDYFTYKGISPRVLVAFISDFKNKHTFQKIDFSLFDKEFSEQFSISWTDYIPSWFSRNSLPKYLIKDLSLIRVQTVPEKNKSNSIRLEFSIFNDSDTDGIINLQYNTPLPREEAKIASKVGKNPYITDYSAYKINARTGMQFRIVRHSLSTVSLNTNTSLNVPDALKTGMVGIFTNDTTTYIRPIRKDYFLPHPDEIIVDNEDVGFKIQEPSSTFKIGKYFQKEKTNIYDNALQHAIIGEDYWKVFTNSYTYGLTFRRALYKKSGHGKSNLIWQTKLEREGLYEIFVYIPYKPPFASNQEYTISCDTESKTVSMVIHTSEEWISLGTFHCPTGISRVSLSDKGNANQIIIGDAVKWVYIKQ